MTKTTNSSNRGFAAMDHNSQHRIASLGGRAAHQSGRAHEFDSDEARRAGHLGGTTVSRDRSHMAEIGAKGGRARGANKNKQAAGQSAAPAPAAPEGTNTSKDAERAATLDGQDATSAADEREPAHTP